MYDHQQAGQVYLRQAVETASPATRLLMLFDRLVGDLANAERATAATPCDYETANTALQHAQQIVAALDATLDVTTWSTAGQLSDLYRWLLRELLAANVDKDVGRVRSCARVVTSMRDAWRLAALRLSGVDSPVDGQAVSVA